MVSPRLKWLVVILSVALGLMQAQAHAQVYRDSADHWEFVPADGWKEQQGLAAMTNEMVSGRMPDAKGRFLTAFVRTEHVYVMVRFVDAKMGGATYEAIEKGFGAAEPAAKAQLKEKIS